VRASRSLASMHRLYAAPMHPGVHPAMGAALGMGADECLTRKFNWSLVVAGAGGVATAVACAVYLQRAFPKTQLGGVGAIAGVVTLPIWWQLGFALASAVAPCEQRSYNEGSA